MRRSRKSRTWGKDGEPCPKKKETTIAGKMSPVAASTTKLRKEANRAIGKVARRKRVRDQTGNQGKRIKGTEASQLPEFAKYMDLQVRNKKKKISYRKLGIVWTLRGKISVRGGQKHKLNQTTETTTQSSRNKGFQ